MSLQTICFLWGIGFTLKKWNGRRLHIEQKQPRYQKKQEGSNEKNASENPLGTKRLQCSLKC